MAVAYFTIPETGKIIYDGDTVMLSEYPNTMAVTAYGWYRYNDEAMNGWHFILLPSKMVVPASQVNLSRIVVVPNSSDDCRPPVPINPFPRSLEQRAFITLDSIAQRDKLVSPFMPNGKIVRVNNRGDGKPGYYEWNIMTQTWDDWDISSVSPGPVPENVAKIGIKEVVNSVDSTEYTDEYTKFVFKAGNPLCDVLEISENTSCELYFVAPFQVIKVTESQDLFIRNVIRTSPSWEASEWVTSKDREKISAMEKKIDVWVQNDRLENVLSGAPRLSDEELNELLEARLNGET